MTPRHRGAAIAAAVALAIPVLALVVPALMDWSRLRPEVEAAASAALGRKLTISGPISARLLPSPRAILDGLAVDGASAERLSIGLKLLPMLAGQRRIEHFTLSGGRIGPVGGIEAVLTPDGTLTARGRMSLAGDASMDMVFDGKTDLRRTEGRMRLTSSRFSADSPLSLTPDELSLPGIAITVGQSSASASVVASLGTSPVLVDASLKAGDLDLESTAEAAPPKAGEAPPTDTVADNPAAMAPGGFQLPAGITANLAATVGRLRWRGIILNEVDAAGLLDNGTFILTHAKARVAGSVQAELSGSLTARDGHPAFDGMLRAASATPRRIRLDTPIALAGERVTLPRLALTVDDTRIQGDAVIAIGARPAFGANLTGKGVEARLEGRPEADGLILDVIRAKSGDITLTGSGRAVLGDTPRLDTSLASPAIALAPYLPAWGRTLRLSDIRTQLSLADGLTTVERFTARLLGGEISGAARINAAGMAATLMVRGADIAGLDLAAGGLRIAKGLLDGEARLSARSSDPLPSLKGDGRMDIRDGVVDGFDLAAMDAQMRRLENIGSLLALIQAGLSGGQSRVSSLTAPFTIDRGVVDSRDIKMVAEGGGATGTASLDLPKERIEARFAFRLSTPDTPPLGLRLEGRLSSPNKVIDVNALQRHLVERGLGKALKGKGGGLIESLLGIKPRDRK